jgi:hypothetical protein
MVAEAARKSVATDMRFRIAVWQEKKLTVVPVSCETRGTTMRLLCVMIAAKQRYPFVPALDRSDFCLRQAKEAFRLAHTVHDDRRRAFIELAAAWQRLADFSDRSDGFDTKLQ